MERIIEWGSIGSILARDFLSYFFSPSFLPADCLLFSARLGAGKEAKVGRRFDWELLSSDQLPTRLYKCREYMAFSMYFFLYTLIGLDFEREIDPSQEPKEPRTVGKDGCLLSSGGDV